MLTVTEAAARVGRSPATVRRWIREGRVRARHTGARQLIEDADVRAIEDELYSPAPNWVAALHRSRTGR